MTRAFTSGRFALELEGVSAGWVFSVEGGNVGGDVVVEKTGSDRLPRKHIAGLKIEDITVSCGLGMSKHFYKWIEKALTDEFRHYDGALHICDFDGKIFKTIEFYRGLITEIGLPGLDAASKDAAKLTLKISPEWVRHKPGSGTVSPSHYALGKGQQKKWSPANFRLRIDGLERSCKHASKVEALVVKQKVTENAVGELRENEKEPAAFEIPNLIVTMPDNDDAKPFWEWHKSFLIDGKNSTDEEKTGTLEFLNAALTETLFTVNLTNLGIIKMTPDKVEAGGESIRRVKAEMYCEEVDFDFGEGATWT